MPGRNRYLFSFTDPAGTRTTVSYGPCYVQEALTGVALDYPRVGPKQLVISYTINSIERQVPTRTIKEFYAWHPFVIDKPYQDLLLEKSDTYTAFCPRCHSDVTDQLLNVLSWIIRKSGVSFWLELP